MSESMHVTIAAKNIADNSVENLSDDNYVYQQSGVETPLLYSPINDSLQKIINSWQAVWGDKSDIAKQTLNRIGQLLNDDSVPMNTRLKIASDELAKIPDSPAWAVNLSEKLAKLGTQLAGINKMQIAYQNLRQDPFKEPDSNLALLLEFMPGDVGNLLTQIQELFVKLASITKMVDVKEIDLTDSDRWLRKIIEEFTQAKVKGDKKEMLQLFLMLAQDPKTLTFVESNIDPTSELAAALNTAGLITAEIRKTSATPFGIEPNSYISQAWQAIDLTHRLTHPDFTGALQQTASSPTVNAITHVLIQVRSTMTPDQATAAAVDNMFKLMRRGDEITLSSFLSSALGAIDYWSLGKTILSGALKFLGAPVILIAKLGYAAWDSGFFQKLEDAPFAAIPYLAINELNRVINDPHSLFYQEIANIPVVGSSLRLLLQSFAALLQHGLFNTDRWLELMYQHFRQFMHDNPLAILFEQLIKIGLMVRLWRACRIGASDEEVTAAQDDLTKVIEWFPQENFRFMLQVIEFIPIIRRVYDHAQTLPRPDSVNKRKGETPLQWGMNVMALLSGQGGENQAEILKTQQMLAEKLLGISMRAMEEATETALTQEMTAQQPQSSEFLTPPVSDSNQAASLLSGISTAEEKQGWLDHSREWMANRRASAQSAIEYATSGVTNWAAQANNKAQASLTKAVDMTRHALAMAKDSTASATGYLARGYQSVTDRWNGMSNGTKTKIVLSGVFLGASAIGVYAFVHNIKSRYDLSKLDEEEFMTVEEAKIAQEETEKELIGAQKQLSISRGFTLGLGILSGGLLAAGGGYRLWEWIESRSNIKKDAAISVSMKQDMSLWEIHNEQQQYLLKQSPNKRDAALQQAIQKKNEAGATLNATKAEVRKAAELVGKSGQEAVNTSSEVAAEKEAYDFLAAKADSIEHIVSTAFINGGRMDKTTFKEHLRDHKSWFRAGEKAGALLLAPTMLSGLFWWAAKKKQAYLNKRLLNLSNNNLILYSHLRQQNKILRQEESAFGIERSIVRPSLKIIETRKIIDELIDQISKSEHSGLAGVKGEYVDISHPLVYSTIKGGARQLNLIRPYSSDSDINKPTTNLDLFKPSMSYMQFHDEHLQYEASLGIFSIDYLDVIKKASEVLAKIKQLIDNVSDTVAVPDYVNDWLDLNTNKTGDEIIEVDYLFDQVNEDGTKILKKITKQFSIEQILSPGFKYWALGARVNLHQNNIAKDIKIKWPSGEDYELIKNTYQIGIGEEYKVADDLIKSMVITPEIFNESGQVAKAELEKDTQQVEGTLEDYKKLNAMSWIDQKIIQVGKNYGADIDPDQRVTIASTHDIAGNLHHGPLRFGDGRTSVSLREYLLYRVSKYTEIKVSGKPKGSIKSIKWPEEIEKNHKKLNGKKLTDALLSIDFEDSVKKELSQLKKGNNIFGLNEIIKEQIMQLSRGFQYSKDYMRKFDTEKNKVASQVLFAVPVNFQSQFDSYDHTEEIAGERHYFYAIPGVFAIPVMTVDGKKRAVLISVIKNQAKMLNYTTDTITDSGFDMDINENGVSFMSDDIEKWLIDHISLKFNVKSLTAKKNYPQGERNASARSTYNTLLGFSKKKYNIDELPEVMINSLLNKTIEDVSAIYVSSGEYWEKIVKNTLKLLMSAVGAALFASGVLMPNPALLWVTVGLSAAMVLTPMIISYFTADTLQEQDKALRSIITWIAMEALNIGITKMVQLSVMPELTKMSKLTHVNIMPNILRNRQKRIFENFKKTAVNPDGSATTPSADSFLTHLRSPGGLRAHPGVPLPPSANPAPGSGSMARPLDVSEIPVLGSGSTARPLVVSETPVSVSGSTAKPASTNTMTNTFGETSGFPGISTSNFENDEWIKNLIRLALGLYKTVGKPKLGKMTNEGLKNDGLTAGFVPASSGQTVIQPQASASKSSEE